MIPLLVPYTPQDWSTYQPRASEPTPVLVWVTDPVTGYRHTALVPWFDPAKHERVKW